MTQRIANQSIIVTRVDSGLGLATALAPPIAAANAVSASQRLHRC